MSKKLVEDYDAWDRYPQHRWVYNKLELALKLGSRAGPACVPPHSTGMFCVKPIYNLYGMGIGAHKVFLRGRDDAKAINEHKFIPPGYFWCEWFEGDHYSVDYEWVRGGKGGIHDHWHATNTVKGEPGDDLAHFARWVKVKDIRLTLPPLLQSLQEVGQINIEWKVKGLHSNIIEIHLRSGGDLAQDPIGTEMIPHWSSDDPAYIQALIDDGWAYFKNRDDEIYNASDHIEDPRMGYLTKCKL